MKKPSINDANTPEQPKEILAMEYPEMTNGDYIEELNYIIGNLEDNKILRHLFIYTNEILKP